MATTGTYQNKDLKKYNVWEITNPSDTITIKAKTDIDAMMHFLRIYNPNDGTLDDVEAELIEEPKVKTFGELTINDKLYVIAGNNKEAIESTLLLLSNDNDEEMTFRDCLGYDYRVKKNTTCYQVSYKKELFFTSEHEARQYIKDISKEPKQSDENTLKELYKELNAIIDKIGQITNKD